MAERKRLATIQFLRGLLHIRSQLGPDEPTGTAHEPIVLPDPMHLPGAPHGAPINLAEDTGEEEDYATDPGGGG